MERLETLKDEIRELSLTLADSVNSLPKLGGQILNQRQHRHQWQVLIRGLSEAELTALRQQPGVEELRIRTPSLEEMFVAYLQTGQEPSPAGKGQGEGAATPSAMEATLP